VLYLPEDNYIVKADKNQMLRAFNNLIKNSIQAIGSKKDGQITISVKKSKNELIVVFADNGAGIPQEMADKIFSPSFTTKSSGMGLGLAIVKNIVLNAGGNIWFESKANVGTTFYISLPNS
jgi:signal transduction histidine kinase